MNAAAKNIAPSTEARSFLERKHQLLIDGQWVAAAGRETTEIFDPATEQRLATVAAGGKADVDRAVAAARKALRGEWSKLTSYDRTRLILKLADELEASIGLASEIETLDNGMPRMVAHYSIASFGCDFLRYYAGWPTKIEGEHDARRARRQAARRAR
jgi:phenylacetaldehyde dehydrogenase